MAIDIALELIQATVQLEQPQGNGTRTVGTGFLISAPGPDGKPPLASPAMQKSLDSMAKAEDAKKAKSGAKTP